MNAIQIAMQGRRKMLQAIFGGKDEPKKLAPKTLAEKFLLFAGVHNRGWAATHPKKKTRA